MICVVASHIIMTLCCVLQYISYMYIRVLCVCKYRHSVRMYRPRVIVLCDMVSITTVLVCLVLRHDQPTYPCRLYDRMYHVRTRVYWFAVSPTDVIV